MNIIGFKAKLDDKHELECIQLGNLYLCAGNMIDRGELIYDYKHWADDLKTQGYMVSAGNIFFEVADSFSELKFERHDFDDCSLYLFANFAVKVSSTLDVLCQKNLSVHDAVRQWNIKAIAQELIPVKIYSVDKSLRGDLAIKIEQLYHEVYIAYFIDPGEIAEDEFRLECVNIIYHDLGNENGISLALEHIIEILRDMLNECKQELRDSDHNKKIAYIKQFTRCSELIEAVKEILSADGNYDDIVDLLKLREELTNEAQGLAGI